MERDPLLQEYFGRGADELVAIVKLEEVRKQLQGSVKVLEELSVLHKKAADVADTTTGDGKS
eukprot:2987143-Alexandrium_andersonii.AAC.1